MSLKVKLLAIMAGILTLTVALNYTVLTGVVQPAFDGIESDEANLNLHRVTMAIEREIGSMADAAADYGRWDETYNYALGTYPEYIVEQTGDGDSLINLAANLLAIYDAKGRQLHAFTWDLEAEEEIELAPFTSEELPADHLLLVHPHEEHLVKGLLKTSQGYLLVASYSIVHNDGSGPIAGSLMFGKLLNDATLAAIAESSGVALTVTDLQAVLPAAMTGVVAEIQAGGESVQRTGDKMISTFGLLTALDGKGGLVLEAKTPRKVSQVGSDAISFGLISLLVVGLIDLAIMWFLVQVFVLRPVSALKEHVMRVTSNGNLKDRIPVSGSDELALLARKYNDMLGGIEKSNQDLLNAQTELVKQERFSALGALTAVVSHEIRSPLGTIRANLFMIQQKIGEVGPAVQRMLARADRNVERCNDIISELLQFVDERPPVAQEYEADIWMHELLKHRFHVDDVAVTHDYGAAAVTFAVDPQQMAMRSCTWSRMRFRRWTTIRPGVPRNS